jgi:hypothetical protein
VFNDRSRGYLAEYYWPGVREQTLADTLARAEQAVAELRHGGRKVELRGTILIGSDETVFCLFVGEEADVRAAGELAGVPFERVLETLWFGPQDRSRKGERRCVEADRSRPRSPR